MVNFCYATKTKKGNQKIKSILEEVPKEGKFILIFSLRKNNGNLIKKRYLIWNLRKNEFN